MAPSPVFKSVNSARRPLAVVAAAALVLAFGLAVQSGPATAQSAGGIDRSVIPIAPDAPERYTVVPGDTLWDISGKFLRDPLYWPEIWYINPQVENPHLIYPGDVLALTWVDGQPRVTLERGGATRMSPRVREQPLSAAVRAIPWDVVEAFMSKPTVLAKEQVEGAPYVATARDQRLITGVGDEVYVRRLEQATKDQSWLLYNVGPRLEDPESGDLLGYQVIYTATGKVTATGDPATLLLTTAARETKRALTVVTGVSGSGKSSLLFDILDRAGRRHFYGTAQQPGAHAGIDGWEYFDKIITIDQAPIGRSTRSNAATYTDAFTPIRQAFASQPEARQRGLTAQHFSFNVPGGRCERCEGAGVLTVKMHFLPDVEVRWPACRGRRLTRQTLSVLYRDHDIAQVLDLTVEEALSLFQDVPAASSRLQVLCDVALGYVQLGQPATTLSGGEAQRIKLATELSKTSTGKTLYILDEPTTGLHFDDIAKLLSCFNALIEAGNSVLIIEHNLDVIKRGINLGSAYMKSPV